MKVIVSTYDAALEDILVFKDVEALEAYWKEKGWVENDPDNYPLMIEALRRGDSFASQGEWIGWVEIKE